MLPFTSTVADDWTSAPHNPGLGDFSDSADIVPSISSYLENGAFVRFATTSTHLRQLLGGERLTVIIQSGSAIQCVVDGGKRGSFEALMDDGQHFSYESLVDGIRAIQRLPAATRAVSLYQFASYLSYLPGPGKGGAYRGSTKRQTAIVEENVDLKLLAQVAWVDCMDGLRLDESTHAADRGPSCLSRAVLHRWQASALTPFLCIESPGIYWEPLLTSMLVELPASQWPAIIDAIGEHSREEWLTNHFRVPLVSMYEPSFGAPSKLVLFHLIKETLEHDRGRSLRDLCLTQWGIASATLQNTFIPWIVGSLAVDVFNSDVFVSRDSFIDRVPLRSDALRSFVERWGADDAVFLRALHEALHDAMTAKEESEYCPPDVRKIYAASTASLPKDIVFSHPTWQQDVLAWWCNFLKLLEIDRFDTIEVGAFDQHKADISRAPFVFQPAMIRALINRRRFDGVGLLAQAVLEWEGGASKAVLAGTPACSPSLLWEMLRITVAFRTDGLVRYVIDNEMKGNLRPDVARALYPVVSDDCIALLSQFEADPDQLVPFIPILAMLDSQDILPVTDEHTGEVTMLIDRLMVAFLLKGLAPLETPSDEVMPFLRRQIVNAFYRNALRDAPVAFDLDTVCARLNLPIEVREQLARRLP